LNLPRKLLGVVIANSAKKILLSGKSKLLFELDASGLFRKVVSIS
jgi:hypothetical protein